MTSDTLLTSEVGLAERIDPTGKKWDAGVAPGGHAMYMLALVDDDGGLTAPRAYPADAPWLNGRWTHRERALSSLDSYLREAWEKSDNARDKNGRVKLKKQDVHADKEVEIIAA